MKARIVHFSNELPNDSLVDVLRHLHIKSKGRNHVLLALFLEGAVTALREEVRELERTLKDLVVHLKSFRNWRTMRSCARVL